MNDIRALAARRPVRSASSASQKLARWAAASSRAGRVSPSRLISARGQAVTAAAKLAGSSSAG